jgi:hypothetical protein
VGNTSATWSTAFGSGFGVTFANAGDQVVMTLSDNSNGNIYEITWMATATGPSTGYGFIQIQLIV